MTRVTVTMGTAPRFLLDDESLRGFRYSGIDVHGDIVDAFFPKSCRYTLPSAAAQVRSESEILFADRERWAVDDERWLEEYGRES